MSLLNVFILAFIQGAAELLPVSSSAHVILVQHWLGLDPSAAPMVFFLVCLHTGTMGSVLVYFRRRWLARYRSEGRKLFIPVVVATLATLVLGGFLKFAIEHFILGGGSAQIEDLFRSRTAVGSALIASGILIVTTGFFEKTRHGKNGKKCGEGADGGDRSKLTAKQSLIIGLVQGLCLPFRGFSRSGATISTGLALKLNKNIAEDFSFLLAVVITPPVILRASFKLYKSHALSSNFADTGIQSLSSLLAYSALGAGISFISGLLALKLLSRFLEKSRWQYFGFYCFFIAGVMLS